MSAEWAITRCRAKASYRCSNWIWTRKLPGGEALSLRDSFSYLPEGNFGGPMVRRGRKGWNRWAIQLWRFLGRQQPGELGIAPRVLNVSLADVSQSLSPRSAVTAAADTPFRTSTELTRRALLLSAASQTSAQVGYNRQTSKFTQIALVYGYQGFDFSVAATAFHTHIVQECMATDLRADGFSDWSGTADHVHQFAKRCVQRPGDSIVTLHRVPGIIGSVNDKSTKFGVAARHGCVTSFRKHRWISPISGSRPAVGSICGVAERHRATDGEPPAVAGMDGICGHRIFAQQPAATADRSTGEAVHELSKLEATEPLPRQ